MRGTKTLILEKYSNIKFHENPSSGRRAVQCGQRDGLKDGWTDRETGMTKLIVGFRNFAKAPENDKIFLHLTL